MGVVTEAAAMAAEDTAVVVMVGDITEAAGTVAEATMADITAAAVAPRTFSYKATVAGGIRAGTRRRMWSRRARS